MQMNDAIIDHREFADGTTRPIYEDALGQYVLDDEGERVHRRRSTGTVADISSPPQRKPCGAY
jgi:hypothetical protein